MFGELIEHGFRGWYLADVHEPIVDGAGGLEERHVASAAMQHAMQTLDAVGDPQQRLLTTGRELVVCRA